MALLSIGVAASSVGFGRSGGNPGGTLGEVAGVQDALILHISWIWASIKVKYPGDTSSRWSRDSASSGFNSALSSCRLHFSVGPSRQDSSSILVPSVVSSIVVPVAVSRLGMFMSSVADSWLDAGAVAFPSWLDIGAISWLDAGVVSWLDIGIIPWLFDAISLSWLRSL